VLECAVAAGSAFIVTGDNDLLRLREFRQVPILRLSDFLALIDRDNGLAP
jgi:predicted nucleic acid-binding protein